MSTFQNTGHGWWNQTDQAQAIRTAEHGGGAHEAMGDQGFDASEDGTGRGTPIIAFSATESRSSGPSTRLAGTLRVENPLAIAFDPTQITSRVNRNNPRPGDPCHPLAAGMHAPTIAVQESQSGMRYTGQQHPTLDSHNGSRRHHGVQAGPMIRRLTPLECERLQGFPDGWTCLCQPLAAYADDPDAAALRCRCPDSPRYRALGNAVTVPVIEWLGHRLMRA